MIDVDLAQELVKKHTVRLSKRMDLRLKDALNFVLAKDVVSKIDMPPFRQSAMDGYAVNVWDKDRYTLIGEIQAGDNQNPKLMPGEAVRIFTGAPVPDAATAVVMQEKVVMEENRLKLETSLHPEMNIRPRGEQIKEGGVALTSGTNIKGPHIGFLASLGITEITVSDKPSIAIVVTGNELVSPGTPLPYGKIYESNGAMLEATLNEVGYENSTVMRIADDYEDTKNVLENCIANFDVVVVTGGVSVGDYDFVGKALRALGVTEVFYKVKQKPGKPLFFGKKDGVSIFGLPGNPGAALSCFYLYVYPLLKMTEGALEPQLPTIKLPLCDAYAVKGSRAQFLKAKTTPDGVAILDGQSSAMLSAYGTANALVFLPENTTELQKGETVKTILLPF